MSDGKKWIYFFKEFSSITMMAAQKMTLDEAKQCVEDAGCTCRVTRNNFYEADIRVFEGRPRCACGREHQIVWFYDEPTVLVCTDCEITVENGKAHCPLCGRPVAEFTLTPNSAEEQAAWDNRDEEGE